ncbi:MAG TPA: PAS domain S-box protein, partial [Deferrisomatales bacterium]|nr:PAS domain S-box protein [Deferrisomatales bacterium]
LPSIHGSYLEVELLGRTFTEMLAALDAREGQLAESEHRFRELTELLPQVVFETDLAGNVTYANQHGFELMGVAAEDLAAGLSVVRFIAPEDQQRALANMQLRLRGEEVPANEYSMVAADGRSLSALIYTNPILRDGQPVGLRGVLVDITRRRAMENALRFTQFAMDHLSDPAYFIRPDGRFAYANEAACTELGYSREELLALSVFAVNPDLPPARWQEHWEEARRDGFLQTTTNHHTKGGESLPVEIALNYVAFGGEEYLCAVARDLSERLAMEARVRQSQKMEAVGTLASGIAHDFNNLLQAIAGSTELLLAATSDATSRQRLEQVAAAADSAAELVQQILTFSRRSNPARRPIDLNREVSHAAEMLRRTLPKMVHIEERLDPELWHANADATQVEQVLMNLGTNARDAMPGGGRLTLTTRNRHIDGHPELAPGPYVELTVRDDGAGMCPETRERIFEPFFTTKGVGEGTGLGLSTVYGVVQAHGGHLHCDSAPGAGTTFTITLPAIPDAPGHVAGATPDSAPLPGGKERVLVVDDEEMVRELAASALEACGYRVDLAERGEDALELYGNALADAGNGSGGRFAAVILDLGMPGMGGRRCLEELRGLDPDARVLVASGYGGPTLQQDVLAAGAAAFVGKPYRLVELCGALRGLLDLAPANTPES